MFASISLKKTLPSLALGLLLGLTPLATMAQTGAAPSGNASGHHAQWEARHNAEESAILDQLNLTADQRKKLDAIKTQAKTEGRSARQQMHQQHRDFETYLFSPGATEQGANAKIDVNAQRMAQMGKLRVHTLFEMKKVMTPEQFQKFGTLQHDRWEKKMQQHHMMKSGEQG